MIGCFALGILVGLIAEMIIENETIKQLMDENHNLKLKNEALTRECKHEVIEIIDNRTTPEEVDYFKPF